MKRNIVIFVIMLFATWVSSPSFAQTSSTKKERNLITAGNKLYKEGKIKEAIL
ncbi:MAG: hypothetical protein J1E95_10665 [Muribaculaceae bacterium]|nr:hypothetical protein [Muribaculaceae bacterium]